MSLTTIGIIVATVMLGSIYPVEGQQPKQIPRVGWISLFGRSRPSMTAFTDRSSPRRTAFMEELRERRYILGQNIIIEYRSAGGSEDRLAEIAAELVRLKVHVIVADTNAAAYAAEKATTTIPVIFVVGNPVWDGRVSSLAKPGGNLTGLSTLAPQLAGKRLELLKDAFPKISRVGVLLNLDGRVHPRQFAEMKDVARSLGIELQPLGLRDSDLNFEELFQQASRQRADAVLTLPNPAVFEHRKKLLYLAAKNRLAAIYYAREFVDAGGLMSYGPISAELYRRVAFYVDRILQGAKPADLPIEQPTKFELVINLKTAKSLGLTIPPEVLMWADEVIK